MRLTSSISGSLTDALKDYEAQVAKRVTAATAVAEEGLKQDVRAAITGAGLGKLSRAIGGASYPNQGRASLRPAAEVFVRGKAASARRWEGVLEAYTTGATIRARKGWLAIPTKDTPRAARGRAMTPDEVAQRFGPLTSLAKGKTVLLFANLVAGKSGGARRATAGRAAQGRVGKPVLVFVLVREASVKRRLDLNAVYAKWDRAYPAMIEAAVKEASA